LSDWPLRARLVAIAVLPTAAALSLAGLGIHTSAETTAVYRHAQQQIQLDEAAAKLAGTLQDERDAMTAWITSGRPVGRDELDNSVAASRAAAGMFGSAAGRAGETGNPATMALYNQITTRAGSLDRLRDAADDPNFPVDAATSSYTAVIGSILDLEQQFGTDVTDEGLRDRQLGIVLVARIREYSAQQGVYLRKAAVLGTLQPAQQTAMVNAGVSLVNLVTEFDANAPEQARELYADTISGAAVNQRYQLEELAETRLRGGLTVGLDPAEVARASAQTLTLMKEVEAGLLTDADEDAGALYDRARWNLITTSALIVAGLLLVLLVMAIVTRSLSKPLRRLHATAIDVAENQLPAAIERIMAEPDPAAAMDSAIAPVAVTSTDEIGRVARAFELVHERAVRLAVEQAMLRDNVKDIFVDLARRSQRLVARQLSIVDRLEFDEEDPDRLAFLFELDHLTTLLRRNGDSLLVLSGTASGRTGPGRLQISEVLGAAISEIEQYARVRIERFPEVAVHGFAAQDVVHLLAELLDNATYFSEPDTEVLVRAARRHDGAVVIQIDDEGVGMPGQQLAELNARLASPPDLDATMTRRMGLHVVAQLAKRRGIEVWLRSKERPQNGIDARVFIPAVLITHYQGAPAVLGTMPLVTNATAATAEDPRRSPGPRKSSPGDDSPDRAEDSLPASRLPIYQAVVSNWFQAQSTQLLNPSAAELDRGDEVVEADRGQVGDVGRDDVRRTGAVDAGPDLDGTTVQFQRRRDSGADDVLATGTG
jgi:signal transduction histidine kinase